MLEFLLTNWEVILERPALFLLVLSISVYFLFVKIRQWYIDFERNQQDKNSKNGDLIKECLERDPNLSTDELSERKNRVDYSNMTDNHGDYEQEYLIVKESRDPLRTLNDLNMLRNTKIIQIDYQKVDYKSWFKNEKFRNCYQKFISCFYFVFTIIAVAELAFLPNLAIETIADKQSLLMVGAVASTMVFSLFISFLTLQEHRKLQAAKRLVEELKNQIVSFKSLNKSDV